MAGLALFKSELTRIINENLNMNNTQAIEPPKLSKKNRNKTWGLLIGGAVSAALIYFMFKDIDWTNFFIELKRVNLAYLPAILSLLCLSYFIRSLRWKYLLSADLNPKFSSLFKATAIGLLAILVLPLRAGEVARPFLLSKYENIGFTKSLASIVTERVFDVLAVLVMLAFSFSQIQTEIELIRLGAPALAILASAIILLIILSYLIGDKIEALTKFISTKLLSKRFPALSAKICDMAAEFIDGLRSFSSFSQFMMVIALTTSLWLLYALVYHITLLSFSAPSTLAIGMVVNVMIALAIAAPAAPGFIGTFQLGCVVALTVVYTGYTHELVLAYSLFIHVVQAIFAVSLGLATLYASGLSLESILKPTKEEQ